MTFAAGVLRYPDLFPARLAGDPAGGESFVVDLPGGPYAVECLSRGQYEAMAGRYGDWRADPNADPAVTIRVFAADVGDFLNPCVPGWEYELEQDSTPETLRHAGLQFVARLERGSRIKGAVWTSFDGGGEFIGAIENTLRPLVANQLLMSGGLLLHSCGIVINGRCITFVGHSGAGKSTIAGMALERGHKVLSDDLNFIARKGAAWVSSRMPFAGDHQGSADPEEFPIAAIVRLRQGTENLLEPLSPGDGFSLLFSSSPFVNVDAHQAGRLEATVEAILDSIPGWTLTFRKDSTVWPMIEAL